MSGTVPAGRDPGPLLLGTRWPTDEPGGLERYVADLHAALRAGPAPSTRTVVLGPSDGVPPGVVVAGRADRPLPARLAAYAAGVTRILADGDVGVVDAHFALLALPVLPRLRRRGIPLVVHVHGPWADEVAVARGATRGRRARRWVERRVYRSAARVVVLSEAVARVVVERYGVPAGRVEVIPPGVDVERLRPLPAPDRADRRTARGVPDDDLLVVTVRRLTTRTGVPDLIDAWPRVRAALATTGRGARLVVIGDGPERTAVERAAAAVRARGGATAGPADDIEVLGRVDDDEVATWLALADLSVVPSRALEGFGLAVLESLAVGTPVIVTDVGGLPDAVRGLDPSLVVAAGHPVALADRIVAAAAGRVPTGAACRAHAERFAWPVVAERHARLLAEVAETATVAGGAGPRPGARPRRVVAVDHCARVSGAEIALSRLVAAVPDTEVHVVLLEPGPMEDRFRSAGATVEVRPVPDAVGGVRRADLTCPGRVLRALGALPVAVAGMARRLRALDPDVVHVNSLKAGFIGGLAARIAGLPVVWHVHDRLADDAMPGPAARATRVAVAVLADAVVAPSAAVAATLPPPRVRRPVVVVPDPLPPDGPRRVPVGPGPGPRPGAGDGLRIVMVGRLAPWKGQDVFVEAFARAFPAGGARAELVGGALFGEESFADHLARRIGDLGLARRVVLRGHVDDVDDVYRAADVVVHASTAPEPFGQVVTEAQAAGVAVVAAAAGGPAERVTDGVDGLLVPPGDVDALAAALTLLAEDPELRARLAGRGPDAVADLRPEVVGPRMAAVWDEVTVRRRGRPRRWRRRRGRS